MAILQPNQVPPKVVRELDPSIEVEINRMLANSTWEWQMDTEWLHDKALIIETLALAGWNCKISQRSCVDDEVHPWWIVLKPTARVVDGVTIKTGD